MAAANQNVQVKRRQRTHAASGGASEALPHEVGARPSRSEPKLNTHALYPSRSELRGITFKNKYTKFKMIFIIFCSIFCSIYCAIEMIAFVRYIALALNIE